MASSNEVVRWGTKIIAWISDGMMDAWLFSVREISELWAKHSNATITPKHVLIIILFIIIVSAVGWVVWHLLGLLREIAIAMVVLLTAVYSVGLMAALFNLLWTIKI